MVGVSQRLGGSTGRTPGALCLVRQLPYAPVDAGDRAACVGLLPSALEATITRMRAEWNGVVLAESDDIVTVEGNAYFPEASIAREHFSPSDTHTVCGWKG